MKKKGFTLIELLAVIVILAVIAVIITPVISEVIESARKAAAKTSAQGYIDAVKNRISLAILDKNPLSGTNTVSDLESEVEYKGTRIERGVVTISDDTLTEAKLCVNGYSFVYRNDKIDNSDINYCVDKSNIEISILGSTSTQELNNQYSYDVDLSSYDLTTATNMACNNNAVPSISENTLHIENIYGDTKCSIESSIATTFDNLDDTTNNVVMIKDETINSNLAVETNKNVILDINGNTFSYPIIQLHGMLTAIDSKNSGKIVATSNAFNLNQSSKLIIRNLNFESAAHGVWIAGNSVNSRVDIYDSNFTTTGKGIGVHGDTTGAVVNVYGNTSITSTNYTIENNGNNNVINIYSGKYVSTGEMAIRNSSPQATSHIDIVQTSNPVYVSTLVQAWKPAIVNNSPGTINITANQANACTANASDTTSGLCVYAEGDRASSGNTGNGAVQNTGSGSININGGTYYGHSQGLNNRTTGTLTIDGAVVTSEKTTIQNQGANSTNGILIVRNSALLSNVDKTLYNASVGELTAINCTVTSNSNNAVTNSSTGVINICNIQITSSTNSKDLFNSSTGVINYSSDVVFSNGTNTPDENKVHNPSGTINANYTGTCQ